MTRKKSLITIIILSIIVAAILLSGCGNFIYTVTLNLYDDVTEMQSVFGGSLSHIKIPQREGYNFEGWFYDSEFNLPYNDGDSINSNITLYAKWSLGEITVTYYLDSINSIQQTTAIGEDLIENPQLTGFIFVGWYTDAGLTVPYESDKATKTMDLYAKWEKMVTCKLFINGEFFKKVYSRVGTTVDVDDTDTFVIIDNKWYKDAEYTQPFDINHVFIDTDTTNEINLYARGKATNVQVYVSSDNYELGTVSGTAKYSTGDLATVTATILPQNTEEDGEVRFLGWYNDNVRVCTSLTYTFKVNVKSVSLTAKFAWVNAYSVTVKSNDSTLGTVRGGGRFFHDDKITLIATPSTDCSFVGWYIGNALVSTKAEYTFDANCSVTYVARFARSETNLVFELNGGKSDFDNHLSGSIGDTVDLSIYTPTKQGYTFGGWSKNGQIVESIVLSSKNIVTANWIYGSAGFNFSTSNGTVSVVSYTGTDLYVKIPKTNENGETVTTIGSRVFENRINEIFGFEIPETITTIAKFAFSSSKAPTNGSTALYAGLSSISYIYIPATVEVIESNAFHGCSNLSMLEFGGDIKNFSINVLTYTPYTSMNIYAPASSNIANKIREYNSKAESKISLNTILSDRTDQSFVENAGSHAVSTSQSDRYFYIDQMPTYPNSVRSTEGLLYAIRQGYLPTTFEADCDAYKVWTQAREILSTIITNDMTDFEKAHMIYDYVISSITYDNAMLEQMKLSSTALYRAHFLEGAILDKVAVCDGYSKAFELLCRIEGIDVITVYGRAGNVGHAWNKVYIDSAWRFVDATWGDRTISGENYNLLIHNYFLIGEQSDHVGYGTTPECVDYDYYSSSKYTTSSGKTFDLNINSSAELSNCLEYYLQNWSNIHTLEIKLKGITYGSALIKMKTLGLNVTNYFALEDDLYIFIFS